MEMAGNTAEMVAIARRISPEDGDDIAGAGTGSAKT